MSLAADVTDEHEGLLEFLYVCPHGLAQFSADGTVIMLNPAFSCLVMPLLPPGAVFSNALDALENAAPELRGLVRGFAARRGTVCDGLRLHLGPAPEGGDPRVLSLTVVRMDADRHMAVLSDISVQAEQERRLRETEAWFTALVQGADDYAMLGLDARGRVSEWNASGERLFRRSAAAAMGEPAAGLVTPLETALGCGRGALDARLAAARRDGWHLDEGWRARADGSRFWGTCMISALAPSAEATGTCFLMVVRDTSGGRRSAEDLRRALTTDHLTGAMNRRAFFERGAQEVRRARRSGRPLCALMVDADHFKAINDRHGHDGGDAALRALAGVLRDGLREGELLGRIGGEEFAVLLPGTGAVDGAAAAERLREAVSAIALEHGGAGVVLTASLGVAVLGPDSPNLEGLLAAADRALYRAKREGRNRVRVADEAHATS